MSERPDMPTTPGPEARATMAFGEPELAGLFKAMGVEPHPMLALPSLEWVRALMAVQPAGWQAELLGVLQKRQRRIQLAEEDPLWWGWEFEPWKDSDALLLGGYVRPDVSPGGGTRPTGDGAGGTPTLPAADVLGIFGGNRASKTVYSVKRACQTAMLFPRSLLAILSESETASITTVQKLVWFYLKPHVGTLNGKRNDVYKINYSQAGGFTERKLILPNGSEIHFLTYNQDPGDYEGWEFGAPAHAYTTGAAELRAEGRFVPPNVGAVADESMPLAWLKMFARRLRFRKAKLLWSFTPVKGITPAIKEMVGASAVTIESRPSELLPRKNLPDVPEGHMPYIRECVFPGVRAMAIYYFSMFNKFGPSPGRTYYQEIKEGCEGKESGYIERVAYGLARDGVSRAFPKFGGWNVVRRELLPAVGTNYMLTDPAGARNWATIWVRVTPDGCHYIYRDWPDAQTFAEWAVPTEREVNATQTAGWDGDPGPAQPGLGMGIVRYKQTFLECERVRNPKSEGRNPKEDPYRVRLWERAVREGEPEPVVYEEIAERYVDPRAGASEHTAEKGGTCIIDEFSEPQYGPDGRLTGAPMELIPASGVNEDEGLGVVNELLDWNQEQPLMPVLNQPHLFVSEDCQQVIWMFENFTGRGGSKGACKDFADLVRYMALAKLVHVDVVQARGRAGRGY